ncbi:MAG TPA: hypothetical protein VLC12_03035 [Terriglobales bacterium]|nr:hypothetical protein [Terriglobales bacterium]
MFRLDLGAGPPTPGGRQPRQLQYFWLCEQCARTMTLVLHSGKVSARPLRPAVPSELLARVVNA